MVSEFFPHVTPTLKQTKVVGQQFLRLQMAEETMALLPIHQMTEVLTIPVSQIVPIPHMPAWIVGVYNWRGEILWLVDLGHLVGLNPLSQQPIHRSTYTVIVIHSTQQVLEKQQIGRQITTQKILGLVVTQVEDMEWCDVNLIEFPLQSSVNPELLKFLRGYWMKPTGEMLMILEAEVIFALMPTSKV